ncbi:hypothetical protein EVAR_94884_1 [Eumeta japonica]|uniref:Uncharacterized protein n=1 Tax=Eumeta variegata TaxID=151549 RepID=A0A4C1V9N1_EUMVA|nr:hypothetical protein EVAR_94884_1 [Eumeta japonica]
MRRNGSLQGFLSEMESRIIVLDSISLRTRTGIADIGDRIGIDRIVSYISRRTDGPLEKNYSSGDHESDVTAWCGSKTRILILTPSPAQNVSAALFQVLQTILVFAVLVVAPKSMDASKCHINQLY